MLIQTIHKEMDHYDKQKHNAHTYCFDECYHLYLCAHQHTHTHFACCFDIGHICYVSDGICIAAQTSIICHWHLSAFGCHWAACLFWIFGWDFPFCRTWWRLSGWIFTAYDIKQCLYPPLSHKTVDTALWYVFSHFDDILFGYSMDGISDTYLFLAVFANGCIGISAFRYYQNVDCLFFRQSFAAILGKMRKTSISTKIGYAHLLYHQPHCYMEKYQERDCVYHRCNQRSCHNSRV